VTIFSWARRGSERSFLVTVSISTSAVAFIIALLFLMAWSFSRSAIANLVSGDQIVGINAELAQGGVYVLLAGDSHIAYLGTPKLPCGTRVINAGINGIKADGYLELLGRLHFVRAARVALLTIGTNYLIRKTSGDRFDEFRADINALIPRLLRDVDHLVVTAVPPVAESLESRLDVHAIRRFSEYLRQLCTIRGCTYIDPFLSLRTDRFGIASAEAMDIGGLHLANYQEQFRRVAPLLCQ
jgi:hypothetical protein